MSGFFKRRIDKIKGYGGKVIGSESIELNHHIFKRMIDILFGWRNKQEVREETFANAYARLGLNEQRLEESYKQFLFRFYLFLFMMVLDTLLTAWLIIQGDWVGLMTSVGFLSVCLAQMTVSSFRCYQINVRELVDFSVFIQDGHGWWPGPFKPLKKRSGTSGRKDLQAKSTTRNNVSSITSKRK